MKLTQVTYLVSYYLKSRFLGQKNPILGGIKVTHRCTLKCRQCPYWQRPAEEMGFSQVVEVMDRMYRDGVRILIFEGGEPLLWRDGDHSIHDLIREAKKLFPSVGVTTNGTLPLDVETDVIWVSIDGLEETHDALRGQSFQKIIQHITQSRHPKIFANITISKDNVEEIPELVKFLAPLVKGITIQFFYPYLESENLWVPWEQRRWVLERLIELKNAGYPVTDSVTALRALMDNNWRCEPWMLCNVEPDGIYNHGCYLKNRTPETNPCQLCGFAAHTEISLAYQFRWGAVMAGKKILDIF